jgi:hypothetical protein
MSGVALVISDQCLPVRERLTGYVTGGVWISRVNTF